MKTEQRVQYIDPTLMAISVVSFSFSWCSTGGSDFCWVLAFSTTSCHQRVSETTGGPEGPFDREWLSLPHLISNFSDPRLNQGPREPLRPGVAFPTTSRLCPISNSSDFLSWLSYIIVQRPFNRPLNLWNGMFDRHRAEITVMQFTGHSFPVHQSMSVPWDFLPCPISSAKSAHVISFDYWPLECVTSLRCITLEWHVCPGRRSKYNSVTFQHFYFGLECTVRGNLFANLTPTFFSTFPTF